MRPILFPPSAESFTGHGLGTIALAESCKVREEANGRFELTVTLPVTDPAFPFLEERCILLARPNPYDAPQPFRVFRVTKPTRGLVTAFARHWCYDTAGVPIRPFTASTAAQAVGYLNTSRVIASPIQVSTDLAVSGELAPKTPRALWSLLLDGEDSVLGVYGGCLRLDGAAISVLQSRGADRGYKIKYGKNLVSLESVCDVSELYTGVLPYYSSGDTTRVGDIQAAPGTWDYQKILPVDLSAYFDTAPSVAELNAKGQEYIEIERVGKPHVSLKTKIVPPGAEGFAALEELRLWDTVTVVYEQIGVNVSATVSATEFDVLRERYISVEIGDRPDSIARRIARKVTAQDIAAGAVGGSAIRRNGVSATQLADGSVTVNKIVDGAVQTTKIAPGAVTGNKILDQAIAYAKLSGTLQVFYNDTIAANQLVAGHIDSTGGITCSTIVVAGKQYMPGEWGFRDYTGASRIFYGLKLVGT